MGRYYNAHPQPLKVHLLGGRLVQPGEEFEIPDELEEFFAQPEAPDNVPRDQAVALDKDRNPVRVGFTHPHIKPVKPTKAKGDDSKTEEV